MSLATELDDPYDCSVLIKEDVIEIVNALRDITEKFTDDKYITDAKRVAFSIKESSAICSLTENLNDIDMWARYASSGKGFCIEYGFDELALLNPSLFPVAYGDIITYLEQSLAPVVELWYNIDKEYMITKNG